MNEGQEVGNYILEARIGKGGMGEVFRGRHKSLGTPAAIKVISAASNEDPESRERFSREARTQARLRHPNIAQVFDHVERDGRWFLISEYLPAGTLKDVIEKAAGPVELEQAVAWTKQSLAGLEYAHRQNVIHRDVKPANLLLDERGEVSVTDFGLAIMLGDHRLTSTGLAIGTPQYMSPEQINGTDIDHRTDIYSIGAVFFELLTGQVPFPLESTFEMYRILVNEAPELTAINPAIPIELNPVVARALAKDPRERYETCAAFSDAIDHALANHQRPAVVPVPLDFDSEKTLLETQPAVNTRIPSPPPPPASNTPERVLLALLVLFFLLGTGAVGYAFYSWQSSRSRAPAATMAANETLTEAEPGSIAAYGIVSSVPSTQFQPASEGPEGVSPSTTAETAAGSRVRHSSASASADKTSALGQLEAAPQSPGRVGAEVPILEGTQKPSSKTRIEVQKETSSPQVTTSPAAAAGGSSASTEMDTPPLRSARSPLFAVVTTGDPLLARPLEAELESRLRSNGLEIWDERSSLVIFDLLSAGQPVTPGLLVPELERLGVSVLVLADVEVVGYRDLYYYGRHSVATMASLHFNAFDLQTAMAIGSGWKEDVEYTELTANSTAGESLRTQTRDLLAEIGGSLPN